MDAPIPQQVVPEWAKVLALDSCVSCRKVDGLRLSGIFENGWLFPLQRRNEAELMIRLADSISPRNVMEIGADKGGSFYHWIKCLGTVRKAIALEIRGVPYIDLFKEHFTDVDILGIAESSISPSAFSRAVQFLNGELLDVLFIDGDKNLTSQDFMLWVSLVRRGGLVFIHDIVDDIHPKQFFYSLRKDYRIQAIIDGREGTVAQMPGFTPVNSYDQWLQVWGFNSCGVGVVFV